MTSRSDALSYRPEIDGLRAVAVFSVILFHAGFSGFGGGFVGVDVFFVISGYLITAKVLSDRRDGRFTIADFYERRARRILPALFLVILCSLPVAWFVLMPADMVDFSGSMAAAATFWSNIFFYQAQDYFAPAAEMQPLLHTWSLAVEEQYYLIFPALLAVCLMLRNRLQVALLGGTFAVSLLLSSWSSYHAPEAGFYLLPTRAWELLLGVAAAFYLSRHGAVPGKPIQTITGLLGLAMILFAVVAFDESMPFPGLYAVVPTVGTAAIILFGGEGTLTGALLSARWLVGAGLISYSLYLWHHPLFSFCRNYFGTELGTGMALLLIGATGALSYLSWRYVEVPFRNRSRVSRRQMVVTSVVFAAGLATAGTAGVLSDGWPSRLEFPPNIEWQSLGHRTEVEGPFCELKPSPEFGEESCFFGDPDGKTLMALYGDSHAHAIGRELDRALRSTGTRGVWISLKDCQPNPFVTRMDRAFDPSCINRFQSLMRLASERADAMTVILRWTFRHYPVTGQIDALQFNNEEGCIEIEGPREYAAVRADGTLSEAGDPIEKRRAVERFIDTLPADIPVALVLPVPELGCDIAKLNFRHYRRTGEIMQTLSTSKQVYERRNAFVLGILRDKLSEQSRGNIVPVDPASLFCGTHLPDRCMAQLNGTPLYFDDDHLSDAGASQVVGVIIRTLSPNLFGE